MPVPLQSIAGLTLRFAHQRGRALLSIAGIALGVALGFAVHLVNSAALNEFSLAVRSMAGEADLEVRGGRSGFSETIYPEIAKVPGVAVASPTSTPLLPNRAAPIASGSWASMRCVPCRSSRRCLPASPAGCST
jgi:putative ABC transport system permease protein